MPLSEWHAARAHLDKFNQLGLCRLGDLISHLPKGWEDRSEITPIAALTVGTKAQIQGQISRAWVARTRGGKGMLMVDVTDDSLAQLRLLFFRYNQSQLQRLRTGSNVLCYGEIKAGRSHLTMVHPQYKHLTEAATHHPSGDAEFLPFYRTTKGLTQYILRRLIKKAFEELDAVGGCPDPIFNLRENLSIETGENMSLWPEHCAYININDAFKSLHFNGKEMLAKAGADEVATQESHLRRISLDELVANYLVRAKQRLVAQTKHSPQVTVIPSKEGLLKSFEEGLPFRLTDGQKAVIAEIIEDMKDTANPMRRLLQGDVGSGKTIVAVAIALRSLMSGQQVSVLAPTEVLIEQHHRVFKECLAPLGIDVAVLTSSTSPALRKKILAGIKSGEIAICLGTHAILEPDIVFKNMGLVIVDEQHKFGVQQRLRLMQKGETDTQIPNQLSMTATPIPRTLAMTLYSDMDISTLREMPAHRAGNVTSIVHNENRQKLLQRLVIRCAEGAQAYWICPLIDESEVLDANSVKEVYEELCKELPTVRVGLLHGQMKSEEKQATLNDFRDGKIQLLVSTTVIEVGVDVHSANIMVIENPERFGLAQLHQLRGRVGRGKKLGYCVLLVKDREGAESQDSINRLKILCDTNDGFEIAEADLKFRKSGELWGTRQHGGVSFKVVDMSRDADLLPYAVSVGSKIQEVDPKGVGALVERWFGDKEQFTSA